MADHIRVSTAELGQAARELDALRDIIEDAENIIAGVDTSKSSGGDLRIRANGPLVSGSTAAEVTRSLRSALRDSVNNARSLANGVRRSAELFDRTENELCRKLGGGNTGAESGIYSDGSADGSHSSGGFSGDGRDSEDKKDGNWFDKWFDYEENEHGLGGTAWLGKYSAEAKGKWGSHAGVNAYVGKVKGGIDIDFKPKDDKHTGKYGKKKGDTEYKWTEDDSIGLYGVGVTAGVSGSIFAADLNAGIGNDDFGANVKAEGSLGNVALEGKFKYSVDENGKINALLQGKAMVSAAEGKASASFDFLGLTITGEIGGYAGAWGYEGKVGYEHGKFTMKGGAAALFGVSAGISIDVNEDWWADKIESVKEGWSDFVDFARFWD